MAFIKYLIHTGAVMELRQNSKDDSRHIVDIATPAVHLLTFNSALRVYDVHRTQVGYLRSTADSWLLITNGEQYNLGPHNDYHWESLAQCECNAAEILLKSYTSPVDQSSD